MVARLPETLENPSNTRTYTNYTREQDWMLRLKRCLFIVSFHSGPPSRGSSVYSKTPMYGSQTPMYGSQTPMHGSRTPMYGSQTPTHGDGKTETMSVFSVATSCKKPCD